MRQTLDQDTENIMATHATHKSQTQGKVTTCHDKLVRKGKNIETALADRALARLMREINSKAGA